MDTAPKPEHQPRAKKKPYTKPRVVYKQRLEAKASVCIYAGPGTGKGSTGAPFQCANLFS